MSFRRAMFCMTWRLSAPSTTWVRSMAEAIRASSSSVTSFIRPSGLTWASLQMSRADLRPMPWMYVRAHQVVLLAGTSTPAMRGMSGPPRLHLLALLVALVAADDADDAATPDDLAVLADPLD